jgi:hypothetical protein
MAFCECYMRFRGHSVFISSIAEHQTAKIPTVSEGAWMANKSQRVRNLFFWLAGKGRSQDILQWGEYLQVWLDWHIAIRAIRSMPSTRWLATRSQVGSNGLW